MGGSAGTNPAPFKTVPCNCKEDCERDMGNCKPDEVCVAGKCTRVTIDSVDAKVNGKKEIYVSINEMVNFTSTTQGENCEYQYQWDLGNGNTNSSASTSSAYQVSGTYMATLGVSCKKCGPAKSDAVKVAVIGQCTNITFKRKDINKTGEDKYGHWWTEMGDESYGWWPCGPVGIFDTLFSIDGCLNGVGSDGTVYFRGGASTRDPHHNETEGVEEIFNAYLSSEASDDYNCESAVTCIRDFAKSYSGSWSWPIGQNCHSFQESMMSNCYLEKK